MNTTETILAELLTGVEATDRRITEAFRLGIRHGAAADRQGIQRSTKIEVTRRILGTLMRTQHIDLDEAMVLLQIPRAERKTYIKLFANKERQRQVGNK